MFEGFSDGMPHGYTAVMALPYYGYDTYDDTYKMSYNIHRDLATFHSFVADDPETFVYAVERGIKETYSVSELSFTDSPNVVLGNERESILTAKEGYFGFPAKEHSSSVGISEKAIHYGNKVEFDRFPMVVPNPEDEYEFEYSEINYGNGFRLFTEAKESEDEVKRKLYNQICLYVFVRGLWDIGNVRLLYCNLDLTVAIYIAILESIIGEPPKCDEKFKCSKCGKPVPDHYSVTWKEYLTRKLKEFGHGWEQCAETIVNLRSRRHLFSHKAHYLDALQELWRIRDQRDMQGKVFSAVDVEQEEKLHHLMDKVDVLKRGVRKALGESFLGQYRDI